MEIEKERVYECARARTFVCIVDGASRAQNNSRI